MSMTEFGGYQIAEALSSRELEIVRLLAEGLSNREIAEHLILSLDTIKWYNKQIYSKLAVGSRTQAVAKARKIGLLEENGAASRPIVSADKRRLPAEITSFVGREREVAEVKQLLQTARLVTLTGPGGTGKTRLGLRVAGIVAGDYADGAFFVSLAPINDPTLVPNAVAQVLAVKEQTDRPLVELLQRFFHNKQLLLVLDNFEHVLAAAPLVTELLAMAPHLSVLATSREVLQLNGEHEYLVSPLTAPDPERIASLAELTANESVNLFVQRARASSPKFRLTDNNALAVAGICARLDGLPLAIELAAARIKLFGPRELLARLESRLAVLTVGSRDLPGRQRTLRNAIDWSYDLLSEDEQRLFAWLAVFNGGRSLDAVNVVCGSGIGIDPLDGLESLLSKSLLFEAEDPEGDPRFFMLETIHEYARERLMEGDDESLIRDRHLDYFVSLVEEMEPDYRRHRQLLLLARTESEMGNLRAAFSWALENERAEDAARIISAADYFFFYGDYLVEGYRWIKHILGKLGEIRTEHRLRLLLAAGRLAYANGEPSASLQYCQKALALARQLGDRRNESWSKIHLGGALAAVADTPEEYEEAIRYCKEGLAGFRELDDKPGMAQAYNILGELARWVGDYELAGEVYEASLDIVRETGEVIREALMLANLSFIAYRQGDYERSLEFGIANLDKEQELATRYRTVTALAVLAGPLSKLGEPAKAARLMGASAELLTRMGADHQPADGHEIAKYQAQVRSQLDEATYEAAWVEGRAMTLEQAVAYVHSHLNPSDRFHVDMKTPPPHD